MFALPPDLPTTAVPPSVVGTPVPLSTTSLAVRLLHLLAAAVAVGGAFATWVALRVGAGDPLRLAAGYEWLFWGAVGTLVMTGIGNLGALAPTLPTGAWGRTFLLKLTVLATLLVGSALRVCLLDQHRRTERASDVLRRAYAATAGLLVLALVLAGVLAHG